ncbi:GM23887 [Drosophila sechellia]|uniref:GM23887 n=1 Tax=Drosophila sechellia TaxID=7238 RepID=B4HIS8_DROSE|nr:GM23887 [Drosophila sechellia]
MPVLIPLKTPAELAEPGEPGEPLGSKRDALSWRRCDDDAIKEINPWHKMVSHMRNINLF